MHKTPVNHVLRNLPIDAWKRPSGRLVRVQGKISATVDASVGEMVHIESSTGARVLAEAIGFDESHVQLMPFDSHTELRRGDLVIALQKRPSIPDGERLLGRVINALGQPIDSLGDLSGAVKKTIDFRSPSPLERTPILGAFSTGIRAIDSLLSLGKGQRVGLFAGSGVGKSTLLGEIAKHAEADVNVVAMIGERGREVRPFLEKSLGPQGLEKSVVIVSTSDESPLARIRASEAAVAIANSFRERGANVLFMLDSITRLAHASRELGLLLGEPPTSRGYTPSVFQRIAHLLEQLGTSQKGSITGLLTVLVDGDDMNEPIADCVRSIVDGHIVLNRQLAQQGHYPAIDILQSASRLFHDVATIEHQQAALVVRRLIAKYGEVEELIQIGAYQRGISPDSDRAVDLYPEVQSFLQQELNAAKPLEASVGDLRALAMHLEG